MSTPDQPTDTDARAACMSRHPAGRRLLPRAVVVLATAGMIAAAPGIASARPVTDSPSAPYCGPGMVHVSGYGCARTVLPPEHPSTGGGWLGLIAAAFVPAFLIL